MISGGQTGADQGGLFAAKARGIITGGTACQGWRTEDGPAPWLADYGLVECKEKGYPSRTAENVNKSDATLWLGDSKNDSPGFHCTINACRRLNKPVFVVKEGTTSVSDVVEWLTDNDIEVLNIAGNRESRNPGLCERVQCFLLVVFQVWAANAAG